MLHLKGTLGTILMTVTERLTDKYTMFFFIDSACSSKSRYTASLSSIIGLFPVGSNIF